MNFSGALADRAISLASVIVVILLWQIGADVGWIDVKVLSSPARLLEVGREQSANGLILQHAWISILRVVSGFLLGAISSISLGLVLGHFRQAYKTFNPIFELIRPVPPLAWIPLAIIWFGIGEMSKVFLIAITAFFPMFVNTVKGVQNIDPNLFRAASSFDTGRLATLREVAFPAAMPDIATGIRISWSLSFAVLIAAEMIAANTGLGSFIITGMSLGDFDDVVFGIVLIGLLSVVTDFFWRVLFDRQLGRQGLTKMGGEL